jgi:hypothetical protein
VKLRVVGSRQDPDIMCVLDPKIQIQRSRDPDPKIQRSKPRDPKIQIQKSKDPIQSSKVPKI